MAKEIRKVAWTMGGADKLIKLENPDQTCTVSDKVHNYLEKNNFYEKLEDEMVEVEIESSNEKDGEPIINYLKLRTQQTNDQRDTDKSNSESKDLIEKILTVNGVSVAKKSVIFKEEDKVWYNLDDPIDAQELKEKYTSKLIIVKIRETEKGNDVILSYKPKEKLKKISENMNNSTEIKSNGNGMQLSIEAQASMNSANRVVQAMVEKDSKPEFVLKLITRIAKHNFKTIQELKKG